MKAADIENLQARIRELETENASLRQQNEFLVDIPTLRAGMQGETLISELIGGTLTTHLAPHDVETAVGQKIEVKFSRLVVTQTGCNSRKWAWNHPLGLTKAKKFDRILLIGVADPRFRQSYNDPESPYVIFDLDRDTMKSLLGKLVMNHLSITTNPTQKAKGIRSLLFQKFQITRQELKERYGIESSVSAIEPSAICQDCNGNEPEIAEVSKGKSEGVDTVVKTMHRKGSIGAHTENPVEKGAKRKRVGRPSAIADRFPDLNERRRWKYANIKRYREEVVTRNKEAYRAGVDGEVRSCRGHIDKLADYGKVRRIVREGMPATTELCFTTSELASLLGYKPLRLYSWHKKGKLPRPFIRLEKKFPPMCIYTAAQAKALCEVLGAHQEAKHQYYYDTDIDTTAAITRAWGNVRAGERLLTGPPKSTRYENREKGIP